ncbi:response regulator, partial [Xanthomonas maliensis]
MSDFTAYRRLAPAGRRPRVLIVDDQPMNIRVLHELLRDACDVSMAMDGGRALALCQQQPPDLLLLDVMMPEMDGLQVCRLLKADPATADIPVVFVTGQDAPEDEVAALEAGGVDFISKPVQPVVVRARVQTHLVMKLQSDLLRETALLDGLTGVANRRRFDDALHSTWHACLRKGQA